MTDRLVIPLEQVRATDAAFAGGKGANLGELAAHGFPVPVGFVITTHAYREHLDRSNLGAEIRALDSTVGAELARLGKDVERRILEMDLSPRTTQAILDAHADLSESREHGVRWAVRSSATAEDLAGASFAGQHGTYYYVERPQLLEMVRHCWASLWSAEAVSYRTTHGIPHASVLMAVVIQEMVRSDVSGIAFTA